MLAFMLHMLAFMLEYAMVYESTLFYFIFQQVLVLPIKDTLKEVKNQNSEVVQDSITLS